MSNFMNSDGTILDRILLVRNVNLQLKEVDSSIITEQNFKK
jgi:hypothetical protein